MAHQEKGRGAHAAPRTAASGVLSGVVVVLVLVGVVLLASRCGATTPSAATGARPAAPPAPAAAPAPTGAEIAAAQDRERFRAATAGVPVMFDGNGTEMRPDAGVALERIASAAREAPEVPVLVTGHTAPVDGDPAWCQRLSGLRADLVAQRLMAAGIAPERIRTVGVSHMYPAATWPASRRVEVAPG